MADKFTVEIISPDKTILKSEAEEVVIPSYEGLMGILKDHIPLITYLRPGQIIIKNQNEKCYFVQEGIVEFSNNNLLILTSTVEDVKNFDKSSIYKLIEEEEKKLDNSDLTDKERYVLSYKINTLKEISQ